jgi:hypothetical protein
MSYVFKVLQGKHGIGGSFVGPGDSFVVVSDAEAAHLRAQPERYKEVTDSGAAQAPPAPPQQSQSPPFPPRIG